MAAETLAWLNAASPWISLGALAGSFIFNNWGEAINDWFNKHIKGPVDDFFDWVHGRNKETKPPPAFEPLDGSSLSMDPLVAPRGEVQPLLFSASDYSTGMLTKPILEKYVKDNLCDGCGYGELQNRIGEVFENAWNNYASQYSDAAVWNQYRPNPPENTFPGTYKGGPRNVAPDGIGNTGDIYNDETIIYPDAAWYEVKAKRGTLYNSTSTGQLEGHITALALNRPEAVQAGRAVLHLITTHEVKISEKLINTARDHGIQIKHHTVRYEIWNGKMNIQFGPRQRPSGIRRYFINWQGPWVPLGE